MNIIAVMRLRGRVGVKKDIDDTMQMLGVCKKHALAVHKSSPSLLGMIKKSEDYITWGELSEKTFKRLMEKGEKKVYNLAPPKGGLKSLKKRWPKGDLGYRGDKINELIERML